MEEGKKKSKNAKFPEIGERIGGFLSQNGIKKSFVAKKLGKTPQAVSFVVTGVNDAQPDLLLFLVSQGCDAHGRRAFLMGNALVTGVVKRVGIVLGKNL